MRTAEGPLSVLWLIDLQPQHGIRHGASLRWLNFARELVARGHRVCLSVNEDEPGDLGPKLALLGRYQEMGWVTSCASTHYRFPQAIGRRAHLLAAPPATNRVLRPFQDQAVAEVKALVADVRADVVIISQRRLLFLVPRLGNTTPVVVDWMDSLVLHEARLARSHMRRGHAREFAASVKRLAQAAIQERFYGRRSRANIAVSPVDLRVLNRVCGRPDLGHVLWNGVEAPRHSSPVPKTPLRLVFSGAMDAPQNHEAVLWFIDRVFPFVLRRHPGCEFVVVGRAPAPELIAREGPNVRILGEVQDIGREIATGILYVAPLRSGCGFKNKIAEALAAGMFVAGTRMAVEFLPESVTRQFLIEDSPEGLARCILEFIEDPSRFDARVPELKRFVERELSWPQVTDRLAAILRTAVARDSHAQPAFDRPRAIEAAK